MIKIQITKKADDSLEYKQYMQANIVDITSSKLKDKELEPTKRMLLTQVMSSAAVKKNWASGFRSTTSTNHA